MVSQIISGINAETLLVWHPTLCRSSNKIAISASNYLKYALSIETSILEI